MATNKLTFFIFTFLFLQVFSADEIPRISLFRGYGINPEIRPSRILESNPLYHSEALPKAAVWVDLGELYSNKTDVVPKNKTYMNIAISSNETGFFAEDDFFSLNCDPAYCLLDNSTQEYKFPWAIGKAGHIYLETPVTIANGAWKLETSALYFSKKVKSARLAGLHKVGWIGLGTGSEARKNFQMKIPVFSIVYDMTSDAGNLIFGFNSTLADNSKSAMTVTTTPNWEMQLVSVSVGDQSIYLKDDSHSKSLSKPMVFDLSANDISLPKEMGLTILDLLREYGLECFHLACTSDTLEGLPPIVFKLADNTQFSLGPEVYMRSYKTDSDIIKYYTINFFHSRGPEYKTQYITIGRNIISHFYLVFQQIDQINTITFHTPVPITRRTGEGVPSTQNSEQIKNPAAEASNGPNSSLDLIFVITGVCIVILFVFVFIKHFLCQVKQPGRSHIIHVELQDTDDISIQSET